MKAYAALALCCQVRADRDVICFEWLERCAELKRRSRVAPYQHLHLPDATRVAMPDTDRFGDP